MDRKKDGQKDNWRERQLDRKKDGQKGKQIVGQKDRLIKKVYG